MLYKIIFDRKRPWQWQLCSDTRKGHLMDKCCYSLLLVLPLNNKGKNMKLCEDNHILSSGCQQGAFFQSSHVSLEKVILSILITCVWNASKSSIGCNCFSSCYKKTLRIKIHFDSFLLWNIYLCLHFELLKYSYLVTSRINVGNTAVIGNRSWQIFPDQSYYRKSLMQCFCIRGPYHFGEWFRFLIKRTLQK